MTSVCHEIDIASTGHATMTLNEPGALQGHDKNEDKKTFKGFLKCDVLNNIFVVCDDVTGKK